MFAFVLSCSQSIDYESFHISTVPNCFFFFSEVVYNATVNIKKMLWMSMQALNCLHWKPHGIDVV